MASGPDHMRASASSEPLVDREWQATTAVAALTSALDEPHAVAQPAEHVVVRRDSSREEREGMSEASVGTELSAPPVIAVARKSSSSSLSAYELQRLANIERNNEQLRAPQAVTQERRHAFPGRVKIHHARCVHGSSTDSYLHGHAGITAMPTLPTFGSKSPYSDLAGRAHDVSPRSRWPSCCTTSTR